MALPAPMISLAHISDIHLAPLPPIRMFDLIGKRATGFANWKLKRNHTLGGEGLTNLVRHMHEQAPDFVAVTGDLTNLALEAEINTAYNWLQTVGEPDRVCVAPGNHDAYVPGALERAQERWGAYMQGETLDDAAFPYVRRIGDVAVIACSSAVPTLPFVAAGRMGEAQLARLDRILKVTEDAGFFRVVLIHHPPNAESHHPGFSLRDAKGFRQIIAARGAELVLHGHTHRSTIHAIPGPKQDVPVIGVAAAGAAQGGAFEDPARYNLFRIEKVNDGWGCTMREYGFQRLGNEIVMRLQIRIY